MPNFGLLVGNVAGKKGATRGSRQQVIHLQTNLGVPSPTNQPPVAFSGPKSPKSNPWPKTSGLGGVLGAIGLQTIPFEGFLRSSNRSTDPLQTLIGFPNNYCGWTKLCTSSLFKQCWYLQCPFGYPSSMFKEVFATETL